MQILVCDDHRLLAEMMGAVFSERGHGVTLAARPHEAVELAARRPIDVCVMDLGYPAPDRESADTLGALDAIRKISETGSRVVVLSGSGEAARRDEAIEAGASRYLVKGDPIAGVVDAVEQAAGDGTDAPARLTSAARTGPGRARWTRASLAEFITPRERSVLEGLVQGESTAGLAARLGVRPATARTHVQNLLGKLCVHSRLEAVALAVEHELVELPDQSD